MIKTQKVVQAFLKVKAEEIRVALSEDVIAAFADSTLLEEGSPDIREEIRAITIGEDGDGKLTASSIKAYNLLKVKLYDLTGFLLKAAALPMFEDSWKKIAYGLVILFHEFYPRLKKEFSEQEAKILLSISAMDKQPLLQAEILAAYGQRFSDQLDPQRLEQAIRLFLDYAVLEKAGAAKLRLVETIVLERQ